MDLPLALGFCRGQVEQLNVACSQSHAFRSPWKSQIFVQGCAVEGLGFRVFLKSVQGG